MAKARPYVLIVEDDPTILQLLGDILSPRYEVALAKGGFDALEKLSVGPCALIITDLGLPDMEGLEFVRQVRADRRLSHIPIIAMSAYPDLAQRAAYADVQAILSKPFSVQKLYESIRRALIEPHLSPTRQSSGLI